MRAPMQWLAVILIAGSMLPVAAAAEQAGSVLTTSQAVWLSRHDKVRLGIARTDWPPVDIVSSSGQYTGITADYLALVQQRTGLNVEPVVLDDWDQVMRAVRAGQVDMLGSMGVTTEREGYLAFTAAYISNPSVIITRKDQQGISGIASLRGKSVAVEAGYFAQDTLKRLHPEIRQVVMRSTSEALEALSLGKADAYIGNRIVSTYLIDRDYLTNLEVRAPVDFGGGDLHFAVRKSLAPLRDILDAGLASITEDERRAIRQRWLPVADKLPAARSIVLTHAERTWIATHPHIRVGVDPAWAPLDFIDKDGKHSGLASDYLRLIGERIGLNLEVVPSSSWAETLERGRRREVDMIALITRTPDREPDFRFTKAYLALPMVLVTRDDERFIADPGSLKGKRVAVLRDYFATSYLATKYPEIVQLPVASMDEALDAVAKGRAVATVGSVATLGSRIQKNYLGRLKIAGSLDLLQELRMGVRADWPELAGLLDKGLASISEAEHQSLRQKWLAVNVEYGVDLREVAKVGIPMAVALLAVFGVIVVANRKLKRLIAETEHKDAALKVQLAFQQTLMDTIPSPIMFKDADARIYGCNRAYEEAFGIRREELLGCTMLEVELYTPEVRQRLYDDDMALLRDPTKTVHDQISARLADGTDHVLLYWKTPFRLPDGSVGGLLSVLVDITELKRLEQATREARDAADSANRAKSSFLATMSHEIRTPMNAVLGMLELLALTKLDAEQLRSLDIVRESAKSLLRIIDDILDFSKIEAGKLEIRPEPASVADIVDGVYLVYSGVASSKNLLLKKSVDARISPVVRADPLRLRQVLNNFVSNALKFTSAGEVEIRVELVQREATRETLRFSVRDTGIGISAENQRRLFQPFVQAETDTTRRFGGTGLGLTICRRLADLMGGALALESRPGEGTTMTLTATFEIGDASELPRDPAISSTGAYRVLAARRPAPTPEQAQAEGTLILVADDHPTNRMLLLRQLGALGYAAHAVENGSIALERWKTGRYALVITDCHMPEMDGYDFTRAVRRAEADSGLRRTPVIACTANALQGEAEVCYAAGMDDYVAKPVEMPTLLATLDRWLPLPQGAHREPCAATSAGSDATAAGLPIAPGQLAELSGGDAAVEREILLEFRGATRTDVAELRRGYDAGDVNAIKRASHRMKGASRMVGALALASACEHVEQAAGENDLATAAIRLPEVLAEVERVDRYIDKL